MGFEDMVVDLTQPRERDDQQLQTVMEFIIIGQTTVSGWAPPEGDAEARIRGQVIYLGGNPRRHG